MNGYEITIFIGMFLAGIYAYWSHKNGKKHTFV